MKFNNKEESGDFKIYSKTMVESCFVVVFFFWGGPIIAWPFLFWISKST